jgi:hypothetical protein
MIRARFISGTKASIDSPQPDNKLFDYPVCCDFPCTFPSHRLSPPDAPLGQIEHYPEGFRYIQIRYPGFAYIFFSYLFMDRVVLHLAKSTYYVDDSSKTPCEPILDSAALLIVRCSWPHRALRTLKRDWSLRSMEPNLNTTE